MPEENATPEAQVQSEAPAGDVYADIAAHNAAIDAAEQQAEATPVTAPDAPPAPEAPEAPAEPVQSPVAPQTIDPGAQQQSAEDQTVASDLAVTGAEAGAEGLTPGEPVYVFTPDLDRSSFAERFEEYKQTVEFTPEIEQAIGWYEHALENASVPETVFEDFGGQPRVQKTFRALDKLFDTKLEETPNGPVVRPDTAEFIGLFRADYKNEFYDVVADIMASDGVNYPGLTMLQELFVREFGLGADQVAQIQNFLTHRTPLPAAQNLAQMPAGIDEAVKEAFYSLSDRKRFELESVSKEIVQIESEMAVGLDDYYKNEATVKLSGLREKLADEVGILRDLQASIEQRRTSREIQQRQSQAALEAFNADLLTTYYDEQFEMGEAFAKQISEKLSFLDEKMRLPQARSIVARITNACQFFFDPSSYEFVEDPMAAIYAKQFKEEGIKFDFGKAAHLLHDALLATRKIKVMKTTGGSPQAIASAESAKNKVLKEIKAARIEIFGQLTALYIQSADKALEGKVAAVAAKKQAAMPIVNTGGGGGKKPDTYESVQEEIKAHNARVAAESGSIDDYVFGREVPKRVAA